MSKKTKTPISGSLTLATCALLGGTATSAVQAQEADWEFDTALLYYGEDKSRVEDASLSVLAKRNFLDDRSLTLGLSVDTLTGATPSGAVRSQTPQTFTSPSGSALYTVPADTIPLDDTFLDTRVALSATWQQPWKRLYQLSFGASASNEYDYLHLGVNAKLARDFNQRNTTVSAGIAFSSDELDPVGGSPIPLTPLEDVGVTSNKRGDESKDIIDVVLGVSQVVSRNLIVQLNYGYSDSSGYLTDPYKIISVVDATTGDTVVRTPTPGVQGPSHEFRFERRPDNRAKHSLYGQTKWYLNGKVLDASYRYMTDDWDIDSHTLDVRYRWPMMGGKAYLEPHVRFYTQTEAEFYRVSLVDGQALPNFASSDYRLGDFDAITAGLKFGWTTESGRQWSVRAELYQQDGDLPANQLFGNQIGGVEYPDLDAVIVQFSYHFSK